MWTAPLRQVLNRRDDDRGRVHVSGLLVQPFFTTAGPDVGREVDPDHLHGLDTRDQKKVLPPRRSIDQHHTMSIVDIGGAIDGLVDATMDHDGPGHPRGLLGDRDRRLLGRHAAEQLRDPRSFVRASLCLAHDGGAEIDANIEALPSPPLWKTSLCRSAGC